MQKVPNGTTHNKRPVWLSILGSLLVMSSFVLLYDTNRRENTDVVNNVASAYDYEINQSVDESATYFESSFYEDGPGVKNTAYISDLTNQLELGLHYSYQATRPMNLTSTYSVVAVISQKYGLGTNNEEVLNVWTKEYPLIKPVTSSSVTDNITLEPKVSVPFSEYRDEIMQMKAALSLPTAAELSVSFMVHVSGAMEDGTPFDDIRTSTVTAPLDQTIYGLEAEFEKSDKKQILTQKVKTMQGDILSYEHIAASVLAIIGVAVIIYGVRKHIFKSPYRRELDKIYRYHDGLIIKASTNIDLSNKSIVPVESFNDILNLEEELKSPIISVQVGANATRFMIIYRDIVYSYLLGKIDKEDQAKGRSIEEIEAFIEGHESVIQASTTPTKRPVPKRRKIQ